MDGIAILYLQKYFRYEKFTSLTGSSLRLESPIVSVSDAKSNALGLVLIKVVFKEFFIRLETNGYMVSVWR